VDGFPSLSFYIDDFSSIYLGFGFEILLKFCYYIFSKAKHVINLKEKSQF
jgi:hypothetical protein